MKLLTPSIREQLLRNGRIREALAEEGRAEGDFLPVVKLFTPDANCTWLLTEIDPDDCQSARKFDPVSAFNFDPFARRGLIALDSSELAGIAETRRARVA